MPIARSTQPESYSELLARSLRLYHATFLKVFILALMLAIVAFIPRILAVVIGQDIFQNLSIFSLQKAWLVLIDLAGLTFFTAIIWRLRCLLAHAHENIVADIKIAIRKLPLIFGATLIQILLVVAINVILLGFLIIFHSHTHQQTINPAETLLASVSFILQFAIAIYLYVMFIFYLAIILTEKKGIFAALKESGLLVWNNWWRTFWLQLTPWLVYLLCLMICKYVLKIPTHIYFVTPETPSTAFGTLIHIVIFALFIPWFAATILVQLRDLELRKGL